MKVAVLGEIGYELLKVSNYHPSYNNNDVGEIIINHVYLDSSSIYIYICI